MKQLVFVLGALAMSPAIAQETAQTPEGAQQFLQMVVERYGVGVVTTYQVRTAHLAYRLQSSRPEGTCATIFEASPLSYERGLGGSNPREIVSGTPAWNEKEYQQFVRAASDQVPPFKVDWSRVLSIDVITNSAPGKLASDGKPRRILVSQGVSGQPLVFIFPDEALAKRAHYAFQFLKEHCDLTAETGF
jgi:hypothetical protein